MRSCYISGKRVLGYVYTVADPGEGPPLILDQTNNFFEMPLKNAKSFEVLIKLSLSLLRNLHKF